MANNITLESKAVVNALREILDCGDVQRNSFPLKMVQFLEEHGLVEAFSRPSQSAGNRNRKMIKFIRLTEAGKGRL